LTPEPSPGGHYTDINETGESVTAAYQRSGGRTGRDGTVPYARNARFAARALQWFAVRGLSIEWTKVDLKATVVSLWGRAGVIRIRIRIDTSPDSDRVRTLTL
jgi:hypothetical protein